jgi:hypothetical protein
MRIAIITALLFLLGVARPCSGQQLQWNKLASGIWLAKVGNPDSVNFLTTAGAEPKITTINAMADVPFPLSEDIPALSIGSYRENIWAWTEF